MGHNLVQLRDNARVAFSYDIGIYVNQLNNTLLVNDSHNTRVVWFKIMSDISELLREVVGPDCEDEISIFRKEKVNCELFWKLDKELLLEMGKACDSAQLWLLFCWYYC